MAKELLPDELWQEIEPLLPPPPPPSPKGGRPPVDNRKALQGIVFVNRTGGSYRDITDYDEPLSVMPPFPPPRIACSSCQLMPDTAGSLVRTVCTSANKRPNSNLPEALKRWNHANEPW